MESIRNLIKQNQKVVIGMCILLLLFIGYNTFIKSDGTEESFSKESKGIRDIEAGRNIIATLNKLKTIDIETHVLEDELFKKLFDFSKPLPDYAKAKQNPFAEEIPAFGAQSQSTTVGEEESPAEVAPDTSNTSEDQVFDVSNPL